MGATFQGLDIAKSGMMAYNASMQTAAHNLTGIAFGSYVCQVVSCRLHRRIVCHHSGFCDIKPLKSRSHIGPPFLSPSTDA